MFLTASVTMEIEIAVVSATEPYERQVFEMWPPVARCKKNIKVESKTKNKKKIFLSWSSTEARVKTIKSEAMVVKAKADTSSLLAIYCHNFHKEMQKDSPYLRSPSIFECYYKQRRHFLLSYFKALDISVSDTF